MPCSICKRSGHNAASCASHPQGINTIPMEITCPSCKGGAYIQTRYGIQPCPSCGGRGVLLRGLHFG